MSGGTTQAGDVNLRRALCRAATIIMNPGLVQLGSEHAAPSLQTPWWENRNGRSRTPHRCHPPPDLDRWHDLQPRCRT
ncbi:hypothetical protein [uncultured Roseobacter sp.]|uniref:hypothetical protein n=1 Tax=uncultured Roseobacter sp. TaxID=114847 RepID=UPI00260AE025|nr:hypothetical protein [uncultured Roseobacter sp.]